MLIKFINVVVKYELSLFDNDNFNYRRTCGASSEPLLGN